MKTPFLAPATRPGVRPGALKKAEKVEVVTWRFVQHVGDLRNLCAHSKDREPSRDEVAELIAGVDKIAKTVA